MFDTKDKILSMIDFEIRIYEKSFKEKSKHTSKERIAYSHVMKAFKTFRAKVEKEDCF